MSEEKKDELIVYIPECCREGWESCPHVINNKQKPEKKNIAL